jgi:flagellar motor switch/type III secretory pathway protein FliN/uncharacterized protein YbaA (DUF1428 family)
MASMHSVWSVLPQWHERDVSLLRSLLRRTTRVLPYRLSLEDRGIAVLGGRLNATSGIPIHRTRAHLRESLRDTSLCAVMVHPELGVLLVVCDRSFARWVVTQTLLTGSEIETHPRSVLPLSEEGALIAWASYLANVWCVPDVVPVVRAVTDDIEMALTALGDDVVFAWPWRVECTDRSASAMVMISATRLREARVHETKKTWVGGIPMVWSLVIARALWNHATVESLSVGEVMLLEGMTCAKTLQGSVSVDVGVPSTLTASAVLSGVGKVTLQSALEVQEMTDHDVTEDDNVLGALPVEITIELARGRSTIDEISQWRVGEVVELGVVLTERVQVRANGKLIARGELVNVDGDVGVRITERL